MSSKNKLVKIASVAEIPKNSMKTFDVGGKKIMIANSNGRYYAIGAICNHEEWDLSEGELKENKVVCAGHGAIWNLEDGSGEFEEPLPKEQVYEIEINGKDIFVNLNPK